MKNCSYTFYFPFSVILLSACIATSCTPTNRRQVNVDSASTAIHDSVHYSVPRELKFDMAHYQDYGDPYVKYIVGQFYPIGWSKNGYFAYAQMMADTSTGSKNQRFEVQVRSMDNDSIVWLISEMIPRTPFVNDSLTQALISPVDTLWKRRYPVIAQALNKYRIIQQDSIERRFFSDYLKDILNYHTDGTEVDDINPGNHYGYTFWSDIKVWLISDETKKQKLFYTKHFFHGPTGFQPNAYLQDPYSNRFVVLIDLEFDGGDPDIRLVTHEVGVVDPSALQ